MAEQHPLRYSYVDTSEGQVHVTTAGDGPAVVLLHWTPLSARMYEAELPALAEGGFTAIGIDLMGFGRSHKPGEVWPFERHAKVVGETLEAMGVPSCALLGAHFSAPIAVEMTVTGAIDVTALLLDGSGHLLPEDAAKAIGAKVGRMQGPGLHDDGSHRSFIWDQAANAFSIFDPDFEITDRTLPLIYRFMLDYLSTGLPKDFGTFQPYDMAGQLAQVRVPSCVLSAETDPLLAAQGPTVDALSKGTSSVVHVTFPGSHPLHNPDRSGEYAQAIATFLKDHA